MMLPGKEQEVAGELTKYRSRAFLERLGTNKVRASLRDLRAAYPGVADNKLKEAYEKQFGQKVRE
jgi:hypothetical protein